MEKLGIKEGRVVEQSFSQTGSYKIKLTVQDNTEASNNSASAWVNVIIHNKPIPSPGKDRIVAENEEVIFDGSKSSSEYYKVKEFDWDFGDGNKESGAIVKHRYNKYGKYIVSLKVRDNSETVTDTNIDSISVIVNARPIAKIINEKYLNDGYASSILQNLTMLTDILQNIIGILETGLKAKENRCRILIRRPAVIRLFLKLLIIPAH